MTATATTPTEVDTPAEVLGAVRASRVAENLEAARQLQLAVDWAAMYSVDSIHDAATLWAPRLGFEEDAVPVAGPGAPLVAEFCVAEFAAAIGMPTEVGRLFLGEALELRYRLPRVWRRVTTGDLPAWRGRRIARETICLSGEAAGYVDRHVGPVAHRIGPAQTQRLVEEAIARFMPDTAEEIRRRAADGRHFTVDHDQVSFAGTSFVHGELDLADALDLDQAVGDRAARYQDLGCEESLDVRRAMAVGELARRQLALDLATEDCGADDRPARTRAGRKPRRSVVLHLHLHESAIAGAGPAVGRVENTRSPVTAEQVRLWCGHPDAQVVVKPVVDLADHVHVGAYEVPDRIAEAVALRDHTCVFPWCTRPARRCHPDDQPCDCDHVVPHGRAGPTCSCNIAPLCRRHHRIKTHTAWTYTVLEPGSYLWSSPHGYQFLRDHTGTLDVSRDRRSPAPPPDE
jgi:hypothetical protein